MKLTKKNLTKLQNSSYRQRVLSDLEAGRLSKLEISDYAKDICQEQLKTRDLSLKDDKEAFYGFSPLIAISAILADGKLFSFIIEGKIINHFLREDKLAEAIEVAQCILISFAQSRKDISSFNVEKINAEVMKLRMSQAIEAEKAKKIAENEKKDGAKSNEQI